MDTIDQLKQIANQVRGATQEGENTAERVGRVLIGTLENVELRMKHQKVDTIEDYEDIVDKDANTLYFVPGVDDNGNNIITDAWIGIYKFQTGSGGSTGIPIEFLYLDKNSVNLELGDTNQLSATWQPTESTETALSWLSSDINVATVTNGLIQSVGKGECIITVKARSGVSATCEVVVAVMLLSLSFDSYQNKLVAGFDTQSVLIPVPENATLDIEYSSSDTSIATVNSEGVVTPLVNTGNVTIKAVNKNGVQASLLMNIVPFTVDVQCEEIDLADNSVTNIFTTWNLIRKGTVTEYRYSETIIVNGEEVTTQSVDWTEMPEDNKIEIELTSEFGEKTINWQFRNSTDEYVDSVPRQIYYKESEIVNYSFTVDVQCTPEQAEVMSMEVPYYKYDKKFVYCLRNDDNLTSLWRMAFRYVNRENVPRTIRRYERTDSVQDALLPSEKHRAPRRLGYTNGCGVLIPFTFDTAGAVTSNGNYTFDSGIATQVQRADINRHKDFGGHFLIHNMEHLSSDTPQKYENDYSYPLQRDRETIQREFGYNSTSFANPDGDPYYTQPCIKDPKTLLLSGGGYSFTTPENLVNTKYGLNFPDSVKYYGLPSHRRAYSWDSDLSDVPLSEIRNTFMTWYVYAENHPYVMSLWKTQMQMALTGKPSLATELTHGLGYNLEDNGSWNDIATADLKKDLAFFEEVHDTVGANGNDMIWFCPMDEVIEYMYYQRVAKITKEITSTGCKFTINIRIPDFLSYKTYSVKINNLPVNAIVTRGQGVTSFHKNMETGLINFGYSLDTAERASRYVQTYLNNPTLENLDRAWYFTRHLGELQTPFASQLPVFNEIPVLSSVTTPETTLTSDIEVTTINTNKEFGEADFLDISSDDLFTHFNSYAIQAGEHKYYDSLDNTCMQNVFNIGIEPLFGVVQSYYVRLRNIHGMSNPKSVNVTLDRQQGVNDPFLNVNAESTYFEETVSLGIEHKYISEMRYKLNDGEFSEFEGIKDRLQITLIQGENNIVIEARNNLGETVESTVTTNYAVKEWESLMTVAYMDSYSYGNNVASAFIPENKFCKLPRSNYDGYNSPVVSTDSIQRAVVKNLHFFDNVYGFVNNNNAGNITWYIDVPTTEENSAIYEDSVISKKTRAGNIQTGYNLPDGKSGRCAFRFFQLPVGKYIVTMFGRHALPDQTGTGIAFVRDNKDSVLTNYIVSKEFNGQLFYDNKENEVTLEFEVTSADQEFQIGMDARFDLYGNDATNRQYGFNVIRLVKIQ